MSSKSIKLKINNKLGLHARPASVFVNTAKQFNCNITVSKKRETVDGKSLIGLLMLAAGYGSFIIITATGNDSEEAINALEDIVNKDRKFNEE